jgi:T-complex protein 1 subunit epsilon
MLEALVVTLSNQDMREQHVFDPLISKRSQFYLATQLVKVILKIDDVITPGQAEN